MRDWRNKDRKWNRKEMKNNFFVKFSQHEDLRFRMSTAQYTKINLQGTFLLRIFLFIFGTVLAIRICYISAITEREDG